MSWQEHHCWSFSCDVCGDGWSHLDGAPHFDHRKDAERYAKHAGWTLTSLRAVCASCTLTELCALTSHTWGPWTKLEPSPIAVSKSARRVRFCLVCTMGQYDPPFEPPV